LSFCQLQFESGSSLFMFCGLFNIHFFSKTFVHTSFVHVYNLAEDALWVKVHYG